MVRGKMIQGTGGSSAPTPPNVLPLPSSLRQIIESVPHAQRHPGLQLDKLGCGGEQTEQKEALRQVVTIGGDEALLADVRRRLDESLRILDARVWSRMTA